MMFIETQPYLRQILLDVNIGNIFSFSKENSQCLEFSATEPKEY